ncbi:MAG: sigma-70 family RNA polymerase sigma factor [Caldilineaceae bacterium]
METENIEHLVWRAIQTLDEAQGWRLTPADQEALCRAVAPLISAEAASSLERMQIVVHNYYCDGPAVNAMLTAGSPEGEALWSQWYEQIAKSAAKKGLAEADALDLVHSTFFHMQRALQNFKFESRLTTYWHAVFNNRFCKWLEQKKRRPQPDEIQEELTPAAQHQPLADTILNNEIAELVHGELQALLKSTDYIILSLYYIEQTFIDADSGEQKRWTDAEIGNHLAMPLNTITARRTRALKRLRENPRLAELFRSLLQE